MDTLPIPIIDIFAGPGGLGEGFSYLKSTDGMPLFKIKLSIEKDEFAHRTLELRAFYRQFNGRSIPPEYYEYLKEKISRKELFKKYKIEALEAKKEAWKATLGRTSDEKVRTRIKEALNGASTWVLIGGWSI
jgi:DNA (cytosine-5)-methyltransferase 1